MNLLTTSRLGLIVVLMSVGPLIAQTNRSTPAQKQQQPQPYGRSSYDPMARGQGTVQPKGIVETTLGAVNPQDKDYGAVIDDWRKEVFENTLQTVYFWGLIGTTMGLGISMIGISWLLRQCEHRLTVSADIVAQLYNAYVTSRSRTLEVIRKYNWLVEKYNRLDTDATQMRTKIVALETQQEQAEQLESKASADLGEVIDIKPGEHPAKSDAEEKQPDSVLKPRTEAEALQEQLGQLEIKFQRKEAQLKARDNQITNLRTRLQQANECLQVERGQKAASKGVNGKG